MSEYILVKKYIPCYVLEEVPEKEICQVSEEVLFDLLKEEDFDALDEDEQIPIDEATGNKIREEVLMEDSNE